MYPTSGKSFTLRSPHSFKPLTKGEILQIYFRMTFSSAKNPQQEGIVSIILNEVEKCYSILSNSDNERSFSWQNTTLQSTSTMTQSVDLSMATSSSSGSEIETHIPSTLTTSTETLSHMSTISTESEGHVVVEDKTNETPTESNEVEDAPTADPLFSLSSILMLVIIVSAVLVLITLVMSTVIFLKRRKLGQESN